ncbi:MAG: Calx-beta domain-containing protein, partial [Opitutaceae bacterium]
AETFATFTVSLSAASGRPTSVGFATADGTATGAADFTQFPGGLLEFAPGETSKVVSIPILGDTLNEADETFFVNLSAAVNASLADAQGVGTILDNDPVPTLSIGDVRIAEGPTGGTAAAVFTVSLSAPSGRKVTVAFATQDGTALAGRDYTGVSSQLLTIPAGAEQGTLSISIIGDREVENTEQFFVALFAPSGAIIGDAAATGTIANDDVVLINPHTATFTDEDGDLVTVRLTHGKLTADDFTLALGDGTVGMRLAELSLLGRAGAGLVIKATPQPGLGGNGEVNVGRIDATGVSLSSVKVRGDLGEIDAGALGSIPAIATLDVRSMGASHASGTPALASDLVGGVSSIRVRGDLNGIRLTASGSGASFPSISIEGDVDGDGAPGARIFADHRIGALSVAGVWRATDLVAGAGAGADGFFGTSDDILLPSAASAVSVIARITITCGVFGTAAGGDHFGFVAGKLGKLEIAGILLPLNPGPGNDLEGFPIGTTGDFRAREVTA